MDPNHPITIHICVVYWKGGDTEFETNFYRPEYVEKIVAWGGFASVKHITKYIQPGIDLISLDPKLSTSIIWYGGSKASNLLFTSSIRISMKSK